MVWTWVTRAGNESIWKGVRVDKRIILYWISNMRFRMLGLYSFWFAIP